MLTVGQKLWYVDTPRQNNPRGREITVTKVGRKWVEVGRGYPRIDIETLHADGAGYSSPGRCWLSEVDYDAEVSLNRIWNSLWNRVRDTYSAPKGVTEHAIRQAAALLDITLT